MANHTQTVTVVNRTSKMLKGTWDGRPYDIPPGESRFSMIEARAFRYQNPVMGRGTPLEDWNSNNEYLIGIKELGDDCSPIEQTDAPQRWDVDSVNGKGRWEYARPRGGAYNTEVRQVQPNTVGGTGFGKA